MSTESTHILVADDEQFILDMYEQILCLPDDAGQEMPALTALATRLFGTERQAFPVASYDLVLCRQGEDAVDQVRQACEDGRPISVAFLDVRMPPGRDGVWAAEQIRVLDPHIEIVIVTAYSDADPSDISRRVPPADKLLYLQKPFHIQEIRQFASALSAKWQAELRLRQAQEELEQRVKDRTAELTKANEELRIEISKRNSAEEMLKGSERRYRTLFNSASDALFIYDRDGRPLEVNELACQCLGYDREDLLRLRYQDMEDTEHIVPLSQRLAEIQRHGRISFETAHVRKDGSLISTEVNVGLVDYAGQPALLYSVRDVSTRKSLEEQLRHAVKMEALGRLAGGVAHDFNNLLTVINGFAQIILGRLDPKSPLRSDLQEIHNAGKRAAHLTRQLLVFSRRQVTEPQVLDINTVVADMARLLERLLGEDITLNMALADDLRSVRADKGQIEQVVVNLAANARDAMPMGGTLRIETANVELGEGYSKSQLGAEPGSYVMIAISDTGCGMTPEVKKHIFEPFFTTKGVGKGTGLGLSTVHGIVKQSGGHIRVCSEPAKGTTFKIYLPPVNKEPTTERPMDGAQLLPRGTETVLVLEDEDGVRKLASRMLRDLGYVVLEASGSAEALALCRARTESIDLVLADMVMPGMSGPTFVEQLAMAGDDPRVLYMSGHTDDAIMPGRMTVSKDHFLQKPFAVETLARKVRQALD